MIIGWIWVCTHATRLLLSMRHFSRRSNGKPSSLRMSLSDSSSVSNWSYTVSTDQRQPSATSNLHTHPVLRTKCVYQCVSSSNTTLWVKKQDTKLLPITYPNTNRFSYFFAGRLSGKFATDWCLNIPPHLTYVATLPCETWMLENWRPPEICIAINDKSQACIGKSLSYNGLLHY